jgi:hypothetical protein
VIKGITMANFVGTPDSVFEEQTLDLLAKHPEGCTLAFILKHISHGTAWTPREARKRLLAMADRQVVEHDGAVLGRRWRLPRAS